MPTENRLSRYPSRTPTQTLGGVSRTTVYDLVNHGELVKVNIGRRGFITAEKP